MKLELPVRLERPLYLCVVFLTFSGIDFFSALGLGFWKYIIATIIFIVVIWLFHKSGLTEKEVSIGVGALIIILGFIIGIIFEMLIENYL